MFRSKLFLLLITPLILCGAIHAQERIISYNTELTVQKDASLIVREIITVEAHGFHIKRGIYRDFPTRYSDHLGNRVHVGFKVISVKRDGVEEAYHLKSRSNGTRVYVGHRNRILNPGRYTYELTFKTTWQLGFFDSHDELYFNAIGTGWIFPIEAATVTVYLPDEVNGEGIRVDGFTGPYGSTSRWFSTSVYGSTVTLTATRALYPGQGFTVVVGWPKGIVKEPGFLKKFLFWAGSNLDALIALAGLIALIWYYVSVWLRVGKDPRKGTIIPRYEAPEDMTPHGVRYLMGLGQVDSTSLAACVLSLATKGYVKIDKTGKKYTLYKLKDDFSDLPPSETAVMMTFFGMGHDSFVLENENHLELSMAKSSLTSNLESKHLKKNYVDNRSHFYFGYAIIVLAALGVWLVTLLTGLAPGLMVVGAAIVAIIVVILFNSWLKAPTRKGRKLMDQIEGYKMYLETAERETLNLVDAPALTTEVFEKHLPYALALGVDNKWSEIFTDHMEKAGIDPDSYDPAWYHGYQRWNHTSMFQRSFGDSFSSAISSSSIAPGSSSGFSGGGGGGFSGGGGGGGGGGGW